MKVVLDREPDQEKTRPLRPSNPVPLCVGASTYPGTLGRLPLFDGVLHLLCRNNSAAKVCEFHKLMLDCL